MGLNQWDDDARALREELRRELFTALRVEEIAAELSTWEVVRLPPMRGGGRWGWPWIHWCVFDRECRGDGCPRDVYLHPLRIILRFGGGLTLEGEGHEVLRTGQEDDQ